MNDELARPEEEVTVILGYRPNICLHVQDKPLKVPAKTHSPWAEEITSNILTTQKIVQLNFPFMISYKYWLSHPWGSLSYSQDRHLYLVWARWIQSTMSKPISLRCILILSYHTLMRSLPWNCPIYISLYIKFVWIKLSSWKFLEFRTCGQVLGTQTVTESRVKKDNHLILQPLVIIFLPPHNTPKECNAVHYSLLHMRQLCAVQ
jgi:hypothetical protein